MLIAFAANIHVMNIRRLFLVRSDRNRWGDRWLSDLLHFHTPLVLWLLKVRQTEFRLSIGNCHINSIFTQHSMDLWNHFISIGSWILSTLNKPNFTRTESMVALSTTVSKDASGKSMALTSMSRYLKVSGLSLYFYFMALMHTLEISMLVIWVYPSSNISSLSLEFPEPTFKILWFLSIWVVSTSLSPLKRWNQSKGSGSLREISITWYIYLPNTLSCRIDSSSV